MPATPQHVHQALGLGAIRQAARAAHGGPEDGGVDRDDGLESHVGVAAVHDLLVLLAEEFEDLRLQIGGGFGTRHLLRSVGPRSHRTRD